MRLLTKLVLIVLALTQLAGCVVGTISIATQAQMPERKELAKSVALGSTEKQVVATLGNPQKTFRNSETGVALLFYCDYGFTAEQAYGYWVDEKYGNYESFLERGWAKSSKTQGLRVAGKNPGQYDCFHNIEVDWATAPAPPKGPIGFERTQYNIDALRLTTYSKEVTNCVSGTQHKIVLEGQISPDSSFAVSRLLARLKPCRDELGKVVEPITVSMKSGGGLLNHGYLLGQALRKNKASVVVEDGSICASSCAVAFLGGAVRTVEEEGRIMFHAPYFNGKNEYGERDINCDVGDQALEELKQYYVDMTDNDTGERLFDRTMWYCSADDGWVVTGGAAAELYGIATQG